MDDFTTAYITAALWSSTDDSDIGIPLDRDHDINDIDQATLDRMIADCLDFQLKYRHLIDSNYKTASEYSEWELAGHDFWLTRNHHGAGFWDGDWYESVSKKLTDASHAYGEHYLYVGDDGRIYS